jgi:hypothetical protein
MGTYFSLHQSSLASDGKQLQAEIDLAAYPTRLRASSPIPSGWLPKLGKKKK